MIFRHLKMTGFKSFAEPTAVEIESGLTGVVGPNGCGKSNVVEALRWVMGESNARQMRGTELDDIIFGQAISKLFALEQTRKSWGTYFTPTEQVPWT